MKLFEEQERELDNFLAQAEAITGKSFNEVENGKKLLSNVALENEEHWEEEDALNDQINNFSITTSSTYRPILAATSNTSPTDDDYE